MEYAKLVAVTGLPGLFELINSKSDGAIVRSLEDGSTKFAASRIHNFSHLESIEVYTIRENVNLVEVFQAMDKAGGSLPSAKEDAAVKKYFEKTYPDLDFDRVYVSDLKKMVKWFDVLKKNNVELKLSEPAEEEEEVEQPATQEKKKEKVEKPKEVEKKKEEKPAPAKKAAVKEKEKPAAKKAAKPKEKEAPAKKAAPKKKK